ncbi:unnamed protein product [Ectocarpus sp. 4 AP-2014]
MYQPVHLSWQCNAVVQSIRKMKRFALRTRDHVLLRSSSGTRYTHTPTPRLRTRQFFVVGVDRQSTSPGTPSFMNTVRARIVHVRVRSFVALYRNRRGSTCQCNGTLGFMSPPHFAKYLHCSSRTSLFACAIGRLYH